MALAKWYKIDFHTHTPESKCFPDKNVSERDWLRAAKESGLNAVVVTDHNSVGFIGKIDAIKKEFEDVNFKVFYGIELCVSAEFTHFIIIFDDILSVTQIEDAVISCLQLRREDWANTEINVSEDRLKDLCNEFKNHIFVIPAHFASNKGLAKCNVNAMRKYQEFVTFSAVEVRNDEDVRTYNNKRSLNAINEAVLITGSDNPSNKDESQHSIEGFGKMFTWIKLSTLSFEGLRQVFLDPEHRCINWLDLQKIGYEFNPNEVTYNYISGIKYSGISHMTDMDMRFSANLNCIIGGRGTGKSTIVDAINYGVQNENEISKCKLLDKTLSKEGKITTFFNFGTEKEYQIDVTRKGKQLEYLVYNDNGKVETPPEFKIDFYGQKEIFGLIEDDDNVIDNGISPLVKMIDNRISSELYSYSDQIDDSIVEMIQLSDEYKNNRKKVKELPTIKAEIEKAESILKKFKASGLETARNNYEKVDSVIRLTEKLIQEFEQLIQSDIEKYQSKIEILLDNMEVLKNTTENSDTGITVLQNIVDMHKDISVQLEMKLNNLECVKESFEKSDVYTQREECQTKYLEALEEVKNTGGEDIQNIQNQLQANKTRNQELLSIQSKQRDLEEKIKNSITKFIEKRKELSNKRKAVIESLALENISIEITPMGHVSRWKQKIQKELGKEGTFDTDFQNLAENILNKDLGFENYKKFIYYLLTTDDGEISGIYPDITNARFAKIWKDKQSNDTLASLVKVIPEDKVVIKIIEENGEIDINEGSPGQKSAAILAFILNSGDNPLIIDQPEDDLDNSLIYSLVVKSIRKMKSKRQIIIVTHNPNIPVLGDAEGIVVLERNSEGKVTFRKGKKSGCIEEKVIREGICDIMEGGREAFRKRELKYQY